MRISVSVQNLASDVNEDLVRAYFVERLPGCQPKVFPLVEYPQHEYYGTTVEFSISKARNKGPALAKLQARDNGLFTIQLPNVIFRADFYDVTVLCQTSHEPQFDVFFIHGLNGHAYKTFASASEATGNFMWPRDHLPEVMSKRLEHGRYLTFGYDASLWPGGGAWRHSLQSNADRLLHAIELCRPVGSLRPIYLVCHSLGGLVACQAISATMTRVQGMSENFASIFSPHGVSLFKGVVFFGTPFKGSIFANLLGPVDTVLSRRDATFTRLRPHDKYTKEMLQNFQDLRLKSTSPLPLLSFYEEKATISGFSVTAQDSARGYFNDVDCYPIRKDHRQMCKFDHAGDEELAVHIIPRIRNMISNGLNAAGTTPSFQLPGNALSHQVGRRNEMVSRNISTTTEKPGAAEAINLPAVNESADVSGFHEFAAKHRITQSRSRLEYARSATENSCDWILDKEAFKNWMTSSCDTTLFIRGASGTGKTVLSRFIVEHLRAKYADSDTTIVSIIYCKSRDGVTSPITIMRHLLYDIGLNNPGIFVKTYQETTAFAPDNGSFRFLWDFYSLLRTKISNTVFYVIDGLDECIQDIKSESSRATSNDLVDFLQSLVKSSTLPSEQASLTLHILFTTRFIQEVFEATSLNRAVLLDIRDEDVSPGVGKMIDHDVTEFVERRRLSGEIKSSIMVALKEKAGSSYQYAKTALETLKSNSSLGTGSLDDFERALATFVPQDLNQTYEQNLRMIEQSCSQNPERLTMMSAMIKLLAFVNRQIDLDELQHALVLWVYPHDVERFYSRLSFALPLLIETQCGAIIKIGDDQEVDFVHGSVRDLLTSLEPRQWPHFSCKDAANINADIGRICIRYISCLKKLFNDRAYRAYMRSHGWTEDSEIPFSSYASLYWDSHIAAAKGDQHALWSEVADLFASANYEFMLYLRNKYWPEPLWQDWPYSVFLGATGMFPLIVDWSNASKLRKLKQSFKMFYQHRTKYRRLPMDVTARSARGFTALHVAAQNGSTELVKHLLSIGASGHSFNDDGATPFSLAIKHGRQDVARDLLCAGEAFPENWKENTISTIQWATYRGMLCIMKELIDRGWDIDKPGFLNMSPLHVACYFHHNDIVDLLLKCGASIVQQDNKANAALHLAASTGNLQAVKLLLGAHKNMDPAPCNKYGYTPMIFAASEGELEVVQYLQTVPGADRPGTTGSTPLHAAASAGKMPIVELLHSNITGNITDQHNSLPIHVAARTGQNEIVQYFIEKGIDPNARTISRLAESHVNAPDITCLSISLGTGNSELSEYLLGLDDIEIRTVDSHGRTLLHIAARFSDKDRVGILLKRGLNLDALDSNQFTVLHHAVFSGSLDTVQLVLQTWKTRGNSEVDAISKDFSTPLHLASTVGNLDILKMLEQEGADLERRGQLNENIVLLASRNMSPKILGYLLDKGLEIGAVNMFNENALHIAASYGHVNHLRLLLQNGDDWLAEHNLNINSESFLGQTPLLAACEAKEQRCATISLLLEHGADPFHRDITGACILDYLNSYSQDSQIRRLLPLGWDSCVPLSGPVRSQKIRHAITAVLHEEAFQTIKSAETGIFAFVLGLVFVRDAQWADHAKICFEQGARILRNGSVTHRYPCVECKNDLLENETMSLCSNCAHMTVCSSCLYKHVTGEKPIEGCSSSHWFLEYATADWKNLKPGTVNSAGQSWDGWLGDRRAEFPV